MVNKSLVSVLLGTGSALAMTLVANAGALPSGGHFSSGKGEIGKAGQSLTVKQSSTTGIIDWNSFSIGRKNGVTFDNGSGATLNRVTGSNLSRIAGQLSATGTLYVMNGSGVIVSGSGHIVTGGNFVASSGSLTDSAFNDGVRRFGNTSANIVNRGSIISGGEAKLVGDSTMSTGTITATHVKLRATDGKALAGGTLNATSNAGHDAHILVISDTGETNVTGTLTAHNRDGSGGLIETSGHRVTIGGSIDAGNGGTWLVDPENLTVDAAAAKTIDNSLSAGTNVTLKTTATGTSGPGTSSTGNGDILIDAPLSWSTTATLTLDSYHSVHYSAPVSVEGLGDLTILTNDGGKGGTYRYYNGASVTFANTDSTLIIDGQQYTLIDSMAALQAINSDATTLAGHYALTQSLEASTAWTPIGNGNEDQPFTGVFDGLGNTISHLNVDIGNFDYGGLFGYSSGTIRAIGLLDVSVSGNEEVGALVGLNAGTVSWSYSTGAVAGNNLRRRKPHGGGGIGGLVGDNDGIIFHSYSDATVTGAAQRGGKKNDTDGLGGLAGDNEGNITDSYATGAASDAFAIGGLVGGNFGGTIKDSYATGDVTAKHNNDVGGLIGFNEGGVIEDSYATGVVMGDEYVGGFAGYMSPFSTTTTLITQSYSTGAVTGGEDVGGFLGYIDSNGEKVECAVTRSYETGNVHGSINVGGFVGQNTGSIVNAYATGNIPGNGGGASWGGFVGLNTGTITNAYTTANLGYHGGGFAGIDNSTDGFKNDYWDTTTGVKNASQGAANKPDDPGLTGETTTQLESGLPGGFGKRIWAIDSKINNGMPYLRALKSSY